MNRESQVRFVAVLLFLLTVAAVVFAGFNFDAEWRFAVPDDGVWWVEHGGRLTADRVDPSGPGAKAASSPAINWFRSTGRKSRICRGWSASSTAPASGRKRIFPAAAIGAARFQRHSGSGGSLPQQLAAADRADLSGHRLYVLLRRWTAPGSTHFYIFCLVSFIAYSFKYTGKLNDFDWTIYWGNIAAGVLQPALFLHFVLTFPEKRQIVRKHPWLLALATCRERCCWRRTSLPCGWLQASERLRWNLDRMEMSYGSLFFLAAATVLWYSYRRASTTILRQQLKWVTRGTILAIVPYTLFYVVPYLMGSLPGATMKVSALSLALLPLTFGYAIFRYRLMDVDLIFKRGVVYTLAAATWWECISGWWRAWPNWCTCGSPAAVRWA
jgi:two-component system, NtrC family, sensor kinase